MKDKTDILYTSNNKYLDIMLASILSLIENANFTNIRIHIITENFDLEDYIKVENLISRYPDIELYFYPMEDININKYNIPNWRGCQIANSRLFFQEILQKRISDIKNLLYLDSDTIIVSDLTEIFKYKENQICACKDRVIHTYPEKLGLNQYYNSGILYFNTKLWEKDNCEEKIIKQILENKVKYNFPDQDILNITFNNKITTLPLKFNLNPDVFIYKGLKGKIYFNKSERAITYEEAKEARMDPKILHSYAFGEIKPWHNNTVNPFNDIFRYYLEQINPELNLLELEGIKKLMNEYPQLFYTYIYAKPHISKKTRENSAKIIKKVKNHF